MLTMETVLKVRLAAKREGQSVRGVARQYRLSRNTVRRYLRSGEVEPRHRRQQEVKPKLGPYLADLEQLLGEDAELPTSHRRSALLLFEELQRRGYQGAYDSVRRHVQAWKRERRGSQEIFIPPSFAPGEASQFEWGEEALVLGGQTTKVSFAHVRLCHSRLPTFREWELVDATARLCAMNLFLQAVLPTRPRRCSERSRSRSSGRGCRETAEGWRRLRARSGGHTPRGAIAVEDATGQPASALEDARACSPPGL
jgi:hypothetical protein